MGIFDSIGSAISNVVNTVSSTVSSAANTVSNAVKSATSSFSQSGANATKTVATAVKTGVVPTFGGSSSSNIGDTISAGISNLSNNISKGFADAATNISKGVSSVLSSDAAAKTALTAAAVNPLTAPIVAGVAAVSGISNIFSGNTNTANTGGNTSNIPSGTTAAPVITSDGWKLNYYATDAGGSQYSQTWKNTQTGEIYAFSADGAPVESYYTADGTLKTQNYYKAESEAQKLAQGYEYYRGSLYSPSEMATIKASGNFDSSQYGGTTAKYSQYLSNPTSFGKFISGGGTSVLSDNVTKAGYVYDSVSYNQPYESIRTFGEGTAGTGTGTVTGTGTAPAVTTADNGIFEFIDNKLGVERYSIYGNAAKQISQGNILSGEVAGGVATMAVDVIAPLDLAYVGNKIISGKAEELDGSDYLSAAIDAAAIVAGVFSFGAGYAGIKGLKTAAKVAKGASYATQGGMIGVAGASLVGGGLNG